MENSIHICVLNIDREAAATIGNCLEDLKISFSLSKQETDLCRATHVIIPATPDIEKLMRKMHMFNLHSLLRMIKKPLLVLGNSLPIMFDSAPDCNENMLGFFRNNYCTIAEKPKLQGAVAIKRNLHDSKLFNHFPEQFTATFDFFCPLNSMGMYSSVVFADMPEFTAAYEQHPFYGVMFNPFTGFTEVKQLITNFTQL